MNTMNNYRGRVCDGRPMAMAYVRKQPWRRIYKSEVALQRGTLFNDLDKPFKGYKIGGCGCNGK
ncbi:MAG TPA: spore coat associated protein CotJA [Dielma fastidiosa]|nr:spore coat associated protein CotJA [Bacillota bacterium]PWM53137.1 MAG: spore coat associated protein CotJA [Dielma fastidiosa]RHM99120.1 spore coat associated protein CotJA [Dielma fastidiosa]HAH93829.1 spore coat associated protein CotJA [Dielma fastidiosa]